MRSYPYVDADHLARIVDDDFSTSSAASKKLDRYSASLDNQRQAVGYAIVLRDTLFGVSAAFVKKDKMAWEIGLKSIVESALITRSAPLAHIGLARKIHMIAVMHQSSLNPITKSIAEAVIDRECGDTNATIHDAKSLVLAHIALSDADSAIKEARKLVTRCRDDKEFSLKDCRNGETWANLAIAACEGDEKGLSMATRAAEVLQDQMNAKNTKRWAAGKENVLIWISDFWDHDSSAILSFFRKAGMATEPTRYIDPSWTF